MERYTASHDVVQEAPENESIIAYTTRVESGNIPRTSDSNSSNLNLNIKNEYKNISNDGKVVDRYHLLKEKGYSHGFLLEEASISVTCETAEPQQTPVPRFGHEVNENTNMVPNKKRRYKCHSELSNTFLEDVFKTNSHPTSKERHIIAKKCGLSPTQVGAWFTNRRNR